MNSELGSPIASGGAGTIFEYRVAALMLVNLLRSSHAPGLGVPVARVALQQRVRGRLLDDIVVYGQDAVRTEFQVKRKLTVTKSDKEFVEVVSYALRALADYADDIQRGDLALGLIAQGSASPVDQLASLTEWARAHHSYDSFLDYMVKGVVASSIRTRLMRVQEAVAKAIEDGAPAQGGVEHATHAFLAALHVWRPAAMEGGTTYLASLDQLQPVADELSVTSATLFVHLAELASGWGPFGGDADANHVRRRLRRRGLSERIVRSEDNEGHIDVDAVVRGPIEALNLRSELRAAEEGLAAADPKAADAFASIAQRLRNAHFFPDAVAISRRRADALQVAGLVDDAAMARVAIAWEELDRSRVWEAGFALADGRFRPNLTEKLSEPAKRTFAAANAAVAVAKWGDIDRIASRFDGLQPGDGFAAQAATFLCEEAIADAQPQVITDRLEALRAVAEQWDVNGDGAGRYAVRIRMCLADATGDWSHIERKALRTQPRAVVAWLHARYARHLALVGDGVGAQEEYLEAVERATAEGLFSDAADWLYALRTVRFWYDDTLSDDQHPRAQAMRPHAKPSSLPGAGHTSELTLRAMLDESKPNEAMYRARRWRWQAVVRAAITEELEAVTAIGTLLERKGDTEGTFTSYIRAGVTEKIESASRSRSDRLVRLTPSLLSPIPTSRAAAYRAAALSVDLMTDDDIRLWADAAIKEIAEVERPASLTGASPVLQAFELLASSCSVLSPAQKDVLLERIRTLIDCPTERDHRTDEAAGKILLALTPNRPNLIPLLCKAVIISDRICGLVRKDIEVLEEHRGQISMNLRPHVDSENACKIIIAVGGDPTPALPLARKRVDRELASRQHSPNSLPLYAGGADVAIFASVLGADIRTRFAETMLERAIDPSEAKGSRWNDLAGLLNIAGDLDVASKTALLPRVIEIACGEHEAEPLSDRDDRISLAPLGVLCAARLDPTPDQCRVIEGAALVAISNAHEADQLRIARGLLCLPAENVRLDMHVCAVHPIAALRIVAAVRWTHDPSSVPLSGAIALARDPDARVRHQLAAGLRATGNRATDAARPIVEILIGDSRRAVRTEILGH